LLAWLGFRAKRLKFCFLKWGGAALLTIAVSSRALPAHSLDPDLMVRMLGVSASVDTGGSSLIVCVRLHL
jgi:hypothetical protein